MMAVSRPAALAWCKTSNRSETDAASGSPIRAQGSSGVVMVMPRQTSRPARMSKSRRTGRLFVRMFNRKLASSSSRQHSRVSTVVLFNRLPTVAGTARKDRAGRKPPQLPGQDLDGVDLDVHEPAPLFGVRMEPLHEPSIAIPAAVAAPDVAVERVVVDGAAIQEALAAHLAHDDVIRWLPLGLCLGIRLE
jgi:hypothetical protein